MIDGVTLEVGVTLMLGVKLGVTLGVVVTLAVGVKLAGLIQPFCNRQSSLSLYPLLEALASVTP